MQGSGGMTTLLTGHLNSSITLPYRLTFPYLTVDTEVSSMLVWLFKGLTHGMVTAGERRNTSHTHGTSESATLVRPSLCSTA